MGKGGTVSVVGARSLVQGPSGGDAGVPVIHSAGECDSKPDGQCVGVSRGMRSWDMGVACNSIRYVLQYPICLAVQDIRWRTVPEC